MGFPSSRIFTISPDMPFVDRLATGLISMSDSDACRLARILVFLPSSRACLALREAFLRTGSGQPMLLPQLIPVGKIDEAIGPFAETATNILPAIPPLRRHLLLTRLVLGWQGANVLSPAQAARLASALIVFLDEMQKERLTFDKLENLVPADYAGHWKITIDFFSLLAKVWPKVLRAEDYLDPVRRRDLVIQSLVTNWRHHPPSYPVVVAGLSHANPVLIDLLKTVATLPSGKGDGGGYIILPGLDRTLEDKSWNLIDETHPQAGLKSLLAALNVRHHEVIDWPANNFNFFLKRAHSDRLRLITESMRSSGTTDYWQSLPLFAQETLSGVDYIECYSLEEESRVISLLLRETLEHKNRTAALVTTNRVLARRVTAELEQWDVFVDDSAGIPLANTLTGIFLRLTLRIIYTKFNFISLIETLKHPLASARYTPGYLRQLVRHLEIQIRRSGPQHVQGLTKLRAVLSKSQPALHILLDWLEWAAADFSTLMQHESQISLSEIVKAHIAFSEELATTVDQRGSERLWKHDSGVTAATFVADLLEAADAFPHIRPDFYPALLDSCMENYTVRPTYGRHPRLSIWGPLEARLQHPDVLILGGLNEGTWPPVSDVDPWMSLSMRTSFGLPSPGRRIGLSAHDFVHAFCAPRVILTRSQRANGAPTVPSRWLLRLEAVLKITGLRDLTTNSWHSAEPWLLWARTLNQPQSFATPIRPVPRPPLSARPKRLSVTEIGILMQDPYVIYAKHVLRLRPLPPLDTSLNAAHYGVLIHKILEIFLKIWPPASKEICSMDSEEFLLKIGEKVFSTIIDRPIVRAFWWPRFKRIAHWVVLKERVRRDKGIKILPEVKGQLILKLRTDNSKSGPFTAFLLTARADRIELLPDSKLTIIDYKTGTLPSQRAVVIGYDPQLPLEAAMAAADAFPDIPVESLPTELLYWHLTGAAEGGEERSAHYVPAVVLADKALEGLQTLLGTFNSSDTAYHASSCSTYSPYQHLARTQEWTTNEI